ncbi:MAG: hypothetical protein ACI9O6_000074 [Glaciecola sp.]|jgi:uncharacterized protein (DUF2141 family)
MKTSTNLLKNIIATSTLALCSLTAIGAQAGNLDVNFTQIDRPVGQLMVAIYDNAEAYNNEGKPVHYTTVEAIGDTVSISFTDLAEGTYALKVLHDINSNGKMDINAAGLPQDGYGFSNNVGMYGVPPFDAASFEVLDYAVIDVVVRKPVVL